MSKPILLEPEKMWARSEVLGKPCPVPPKAGVYAWWFKGLAEVPLAGTLQADGYHLLYIGISPKAPPRNGKPPSSQSLRSRVRYHYSGNAEGSTLRLTLGCLLHLPLRRVGSGTRRTFSHDERTLNEWMEGHALVSWTEHDRPWELEAELIQMLSLPLNLDQNRHHGFHEELSRLRREAKRRANDFPIVAR